MEATAWVATTALLTVKEKVAVAEAPLVSVTVTVNVVAALVTLGVPETVPVDALIDRPVGREGEML